MNFLMGGTGMRWLFIMILMLVGCEKGLPSHYEAVPFEILVDGEAIPYVLLPNSWGNAIYDRIHYQDYFYQHQETSLVRNGAMVSFSFGDLSPEVVVTRDFNTFDVAGPYEVIEEVTIVASSENSFIVDFMGRDLVYYNVSASFGENDSIDYAVALRLEE